MKITILVSFNPSYKLVAPKIAKLLQLHYALYIVAIGDIH